jgi:DNA-binding GntR family transcriptional regulator
VTTKAGAVLEALRSDIVDGRLAPGAALDEVTLAETYDVSRTPVREALRVLRSEGLLVPGPRRQHLVVDVSAGHRREIAQVRIALEGLAAVEACARLEPADLDPLRFSLITQRRLAQASDRDGFLRADEEFHLALVAVARMPTVHHLLSQLGAFIRLARAHEPTGRTHMLGLVEEHTQLVDLLEERSPTPLRTALERHIAETSPRGKSR